MARDNAKTVPHLKFNEIRARAAIVDFFMQARPTFWVVEDKSGLVGFLCADFLIHRAFDGLFTIQEVLYVKPEKRGTRAATLLMRELITWSDDLGANEIIGGVDNETNIDRTAKFLSHFGFKKVGYAMRREV